MKSVIIILFLVLCVSAWGADLETRADFQTAMYDRLHVDSLSDDFWIPDRVRRCINHGVKFVQREAKCLEKIDTIQLVPNQVKYSLPGNANSRNLEALCLYDQLGDLYALTRRPLTEFGKTDLQGVQIYDVKADTVFVYEHPQLSEPMIVYWFDVQPDLAYDTTVVWLDYDFAELALEMAYAHALWMRKDINGYLSMKESVMQGIYQQVPDLKKNPDKWGLEGEE